MVIWKNKMENHFEIVLISIITNVNTFQRCSTGNLKAIPSPQEVYPRNRSNDASGPYFTSHCRIWNSRSCDAVILFFEFFCNFFKIRIYKKQTRFAGFLMKMVIFIINFQINLLRLVTKKMQISMQQFISGKFLLLKVLLVDKQV